MHPNLPTGAKILRLWIPLDIWTHLAHFISTLHSQAQFSSICRASFLAMQLKRHPHISSITNLFHPLVFTIPDQIVDKVIMVHVIPSGEGLLLFIDESSDAGGIELAWLSRGRLRTVPLGLPAVPASSVSNIRFSPDGNTVAFLVTLANGPVVLPSHDPLRRLRGWNESGPGLQFFPCEDCTVQVVDLNMDHTGAPAELHVNTFSHVFVPEYGFDMVWRGGQGKTQELAFAAFLHSEAGAATYLVRWRNLRNPALQNFVFMACIEGASEELLKDRRLAVLTHPSTIYTSRIELSNDARHIFFDTMSKFGILRFDQVDNSATAKVTRADLPNCPITQVSVPAEGTILASPSRSLLTRHSRTSPCHANLSPRKTLSPMSVADDIFIPKPTTDKIRISRISPDGRLLCSVIDLYPVSIQGQLDLVRAKHVEMRSSLTGRLIYRQVVKRRCDPKLKVSLSLPLEKSGDVTHHTMSFSDDSSLLLLWDTTHTKTECLVTRRLPIVLDAETGGLVQDFARILLTMRYETIQFSPDAQTIFGTRMDGEYIKMDAIDVLSGKILKTVAVTGPVHRPDKFSPHSVYLLPNRRLHTVSRGHVDVLFDTTRGSLGCGWKHI